MACGLPPRATTTTSATMARTTRPAILVDQGESDRLSAVICYSSPLRVHVTLEPLGGANSEGFPPFYGYASVSADGSRSSAETAILAPAVVHYSAICA